MPCQFSLYACRKQLDSRVRLQKNHSGNREIHANPSNNVWNFIDHYKRRAYSRYQQRKKPQNLTSTRNVKQLTKKVYSRSLNSAEKYPNKFPKSYYESTTYYQIESNLDYVVWKNFAPCKNCTIQSHTKQGLTVVYC